MKEKKRRFKLPILVMKEATSLQNPRMLKIEQDNIVNNLINETSQMKWVDPMKGYKLPGLICEEIDNLSSPLPATDI
jgi:hypothetical protein